MIGRVKAVTAFTAVLLVSAGAFALFGITNDNDAQSDNSTIGATHTVVVYENILLSNFGGSGNDRFYAVEATPDGGFVSVGIFSTGLNWSPGDWIGLTPMGSFNAAIAKFDEDGKVEWVNNFGGNGNDRFFGVTLAADGGFVAVGDSYSNSIGTGDWTGMTQKSNLSDAIIVKFDKHGDLEWRNNFGGAGMNNFAAVASAPDGGFIAVGFSDMTDPGIGDWAGVTPKGTRDAIIVKFDQHGSIEWMNNFGGTGSNSFSDLIIDNDGNIIAVGSSDYKSFGTGDWTGVEGNGDRDAIIVKFCPLGDVIWETNFGGEGLDWFMGITVTHDNRLVAVGYSYYQSFGTGDWTGIEENGDRDAIIVKFCPLGDVIWKTNFGEEDFFIFRSVTESPNGTFVAVGYRSDTNHSNSILNLIGDIDAIIASFDYSGKLVWSGGINSEGNSLSRGATSTVNGNIILVGYANSASFGTGDWYNTPGKGGLDAILGIWTPIITTITEPDNEPDTASIVMLIINIVVAILLMAAVVASILSKNPHIAGILVAAAIGIFFLGFFEVFK
ncbi:MAG: hypothetical protein FWD92_03590 [Methanomassiliicoccaceae archaeon]|nr:hypothetical protein [Methanomassiliicoccaceae archaeon]